MDLKKINYHLKISENEYNDKLQKIYDQYTYLFEIKKRWVENEINIDDDFYYGCNKNKSFFFYDSCNHCYQMTRKAYQDYTTMLDEYHSNLS